MLPTVKTCLVMTAFVCSFLTASGSMAGSGHEACLQEESRLRVEEAELCSRMGYIFNPSACFNVRKVLVPYGKGKCKTIATQEGGTEQVKPSPLPPPVEPDRGSNGAPGVSGQLGSAQAVPTETAVRPNELELLRREVEELRAELLRQQKEIERLRGVK